MTPAEMLAATAADMRAVANEATMAPWTVKEWDSIGGKAAYISVPNGDGSSHGLSRYTPIGIQDAETIRHIAAWDPDMARAVADWLDSKAIRYAFPDNARLLDADLRQGIEPPMLKVCAAWWKSRGREPVAP